MPTWGEILKELTAQHHSSGKMDFDGTRRKYLAQLNHKTGRDVILYATNWAVPEANPNDVSIIEEDIQGFMEVVNGLDGPDLDLILHSPGGSPEVTEALVSYIRTKFSNVRVFVPQSAMSAATMLSCSADTIVMGKHSFLGPTDPQFIIRTELGVQSVPAQAILDQFDKAQSECSDPAKLGHWLPILRQYGPALLVQCENAMDLSKMLVSEWLQQYMLKDQPNNERTANAIAEQLASHEMFKSHGRHIQRDKARELGLIVEDLETDQQLQDIVLSVFHASTHTFAMTGAVKLIENHLGKAFVKIKQNMPIPLQPPPPQPSQ